MNQADAAGLYQLNALRIGALLPVKGRKAAFGTGQLFSLEAGGLKVVWVCSCFLRLPCRI